MIYFLGCATDGKRFGQAREKIRIIELIVATIFQCTVCVTPFFFSDGLRKFAKNGQENRYGGENHRSLQLKMAPRSTIV